jgi:putative SOS response-associated peptidase YedK
MCYSAQIRSDYQKFLREYGAVMDIKEFVRIFWERQNGAKIKTPKSMDAAFLDAKTEEGLQIKQWVEQYNAEQASKLEQEIFKQRKRLADAERALQVKPTKAAAESKRIATSKVEWALGKLADLRRTTLEPDDSRIFPGWYAPVIVSQGGRRVVKPMRYQCRPEGKPAFYDTKFPGTYNARKDNLEGFWKGMFGYSHGLVIVNAFFENVSKHKVEGRELAPDEKEQNVVIEFRPNPTQDMLVACLWSRWTGSDGEELLSFAAITDEPPLEVAAAGHDRCIVPIKPENIDRWLNPDPADLANQLSILEDRQRPYYEHRLAA